MKINKNKLLQQLEQIHYVIWKKSQVQLLQDGLVGGKRLKKKSLFKSKRIMIEDFSHYRHAVTAALFILMNIWHKLTQSTSTGPMWNKNEKIAEDATVLYTWPRGRKLPVILDY